MIDSMSKEEVLNRLYALLESDDQEVAHVEADTLLCKILISLGFGDVVDVYNAIPKWYA